MTDAASGGPSSDGELAPGSTPDGELAPGSIPDGELAAESTPDGDAAMGSGRVSGARELRCSAKGCRADATQALLWNNPTLHTAERRKVWLACPEHVESLGSFLRVRSFLRDQVPVDAIPATAG